MDEPVRVVLSAPVAVAAKSVGVPALTAGELLALPVPHSESLGWLDRVDPDRYTVGVIRSDEPGRVILETIPRGESEVVDGHQIASAEIVGYPTAGNGHVLQTELVPIHEDAPGWLLQALGGS